MSVVRRSCNCRRRENVSASRANFEIPKITSLFGNISDVTLTDEWGEMMLAKRRDA